ncbi:hypothetical protein OG21DRAFT_1520519 [Imleria badia]|nr:hypothetical protein OG21DRAFT_1520519 [Imleria badia]
MELAQENLIKIATVSQELGKVLADANARGLKGPDISRAQFWLDKIRITSREILEALIRCTIDSGSTPDEQLEGWTSANAPVICLMALNEMKRIINIDRPEKFIGFIPFSMGFNPTPANDKIREAIKVLHNYRDYFDYLLASGVWLLAIRNHEMDALHQLRATSPVALQITGNASTSSFSGKDTRYKNLQGGMSVRSTVMGGKCHNSYQSFNPSQETMVDKIGEENFDCSSTASLKNKCHGPNTELVSAAAPNTHQRQATQDPRHQARFDVRATESHKDNISTDNVPHKMEAVQNLEFEDGVDLEKLDVILQWLDAFRCFERHRAALLQRQADTCTWLPETNEYKTWLTDEKSFLWLQGKAGCGKSVLVASVIEHLKKTFVDAPPAFFYCDFGKERSIDSTEVIRSLLYQLVDQYRCGKVKLGALQVVDELMEERRKGDTALRDITCLSSLVSRVAGQFSQPPLLVIDALDECKDVDRLLCALLGLKTKGVQLFVSSRPIQVIKCRFSRLPCISVDKMVDAVSADIELHVRREINSHPRLGFLDPALKEKVHSTLCQKADGMFRWVQCQLDTLKGCFTLQELLEALNNLPKGLYTTYERILLGIDQQLSEAKVAQRALAWLVTTSRPLILGEVIEALSIDIRRRILDRGNAPMHQYALLDALGSLVVHDEKTDIINLSHFSVKEYLMDELTRKKLPAYHIDLQKAHKQVFQLCMYYLVTSLDQPFDDDVTLQSRPLLDYIFSYGFDHLMHLDPMDDAILDSMTTLQATIQKHPSEWTHMCRLASLYHPYKSWITPEHDFIICVLISIFPESFLRAFLHRAPRKAKYGSNPLVHTVHFDKVDHARTLLSYGVDVNSVGWDIDGLRRDLKVPLEVALRRENSVLVDLLLKEGNAAISRKVYSTIFDGHHCDYLPHFVSSLLQADEFVEWAMEVHDSGFLLRALHQNRYRKHQVTEKEVLDMIRRVVQTGHDISPLDSSEQILLTVSSTSSGGHLSLLKYLFSINAPIPSGILFAEETKPLVHSLTLQGIDVKAVAAKGDTTLHQVLGRCTGGSRCWVLDCNLCSAFRCTLLTALGRESERTLTKIMTISRELISILVEASAQKIGNLEIPRVLNQLEKIILASGTLLQAINKSFLYNSAINRRSKCWLSGKEPKACLEILQQMVKVTRVDALEQAVVNLEGDNHFDDPCPLPSEDKIDDVIVLFNEQQNHFHFLLAADVDKGEADPQQLPRSESVTIPGVNQGTDAQDTKQARVGISAQLWTEVSESGTQGWSKTPMNAPADTWNLASKSTFSLSASQTIRRQLQKWPSTLLRVPRTLLPMHSLLRLACVVSFGIRADSMK